MVVPTILNTFSLYSLPPLTLSLAEVISEKFPSGHHFVVGVACISEQLSVSLWCCRASGRSRDHVNPVVSRSVCCLQWSFDALHFLAVINICSSEGLPTLSGPCPPPPAIEACSLPSAPLPPPSLSFLSPLEDAGPSPQYQRTPLVP